MSEKTSISYCLDFPEEAAAEIDRLEAKVDDLQQTISFFASVIKSREAWSSSCEAALRKALT